MRKLFAVVTAFLLVFGVAATSGDTLLVNPATTPKAPGTAMDFQISPVCHQLY